MTSSTCWWGEHQPRKKNVCGQLESMVGGEGEEPFTPLHAVFTLCIKTCKGGWSGTLHAFHCSSKRVSIESRYASTARMFALSQDLRLNVILRWLLQAPLLTAPSSCDLALFCHLQEARRTLDKQTFQMFSALKGSSAARAAMSHWLPPTAVCCQPTKATGTK